jgi:transposase
MRGAGEQARGYPSDLTDAQWQVIAPHLPAEVPGRRGRPRVWPLRAIIDAILYVDRAGCPWRYLPDSFPPWPTVYGYFAIWRDDGTLARLHDALRAQVRAAAGRDPEPTAAIIDSQSVRAADTVPKATRGWDNAKKVNGRKRHIAVDAMGLLLAVVITAASVQDRDAARPLLWNLHRTSRRIRLIWADAVYTGKLTSWAASMKMTLQIVARRNPHAFEVLPRRWVVERTFAWISKHRRTVRDYERLPASHEAMIVWAMTALMACRLAQPTHLSNTHLNSRKKSFSSSRSWATADLLPQSRVRIIARRPAWDSWTSVSGCSCAASASTQPRRPSTCRRGVAIDCSRVAPPGTSPMLCGEKEIPSWPLRSTTMGEPPSSASIALPLRLRPDGIRGG